MDVLRKEHLNFNEDLAMKKCITVLRVIGDVNKHYEDCYTVDEQCEDCHPMNGSAKTCHPMNDSVKTVTP